MPVHVKNKQSGGDVWRERQEEGEVVVERIYVGDLQHHVTDQQLAHFFAQFGQVILFVCLPSLDFRLSKSGRIRNEIPCSKSYHCHLPRSPTVW